MEICIINNFITFTVTDIIYDKPGNVKFESKLERVQYNACLAITGAIQGTNRESMYVELGLQSCSQYFETFW